MSENFYLLSVQHTRIHWIVAVLSVSFTSYFSSYRSCLVIIVSFYMLPSCNVNCCVISDSLEVIYSLRSISQHCAVLHCHDKACYVTLAMKSLINQFDLQPFMFVRLSWRQYWHRITHIYPVCPAPLLTCPPCIEAKQWMQNALQQ